jgi:hypothetical protein
MSSRTAYLSRLLGLFAIVVALAMITYKQETVETITALMSNSASVFAIGLIAVAAGLALILAHNVWSGGAATVIVTLIGWLSLIKGLACLFLPQQTLSGLVGSQRYERLFFVSPIISLLLGFYLVYASSFKNPEPAKAK